MGRSGQRNPTPLGKRPQRGIAWFVVFFTVFVLVTYLLRDREKAGLDDRDPQEIAAEMADRVSEQLSGGGTAGSPNANQDRGDQTDSELDSNEEPVDADDSDRSDREASERERDSNAEADAQTTPGDSNTSPTSGTPTRTQPVRGPPSNGVPEFAESGELVEVSRDVWQSPAGLLFKPGSAEGHRLKHLARHFEDDPNRPVHGVFDGGLSEVIPVLDQAWKWAEAGDRRAQVRQERGRTIVIARFDRPVGYVGGERGARDDHPAVRRVQLVLEDRDVITAYPVE